MSWSIVIVIAVAAAVAYFVWRQRAKGSDVPVTTAARTAPPATQGGVAATAPAAANARPSSFEEYRRLSPSNMINGRLTCNRCGSNLIQAQGGSATCSTCGAILYGAR